MGWFLDELGRRNVIRAGIAYLALAWLILQVAETLLPIYGFTDAAIRNLVVVLVIGLFVTLALSWVFEWTPKGIIKDPGTPASSPASREIRKQLDQFIIVVLVIAVTFFSVDKFVLDPVRDAEQIEAAKDEARTEAIVDSYGDKSIAVLAFADMSPAGDQEYFSDGIAEEILNVLTTVSELRVISRSTSFTFKHGNSSVSEIAEKLDVTYVLEGSVRKAGNKIRVTAQLIDARTDSHLWSETYDREFEDIFAVQDEISSSIVDELRLTLVDGDRAGNDIDPESYEKYLKALHIVHASKSEQLREAQVFLNEVLVASPDYIPALNALGRLYYRIPKTEGMTAAENTAEIHALADKVVAIAPDGIDALIWQGWFAYTAGNHNEAAAFYERAAKVDPTDTSLLRVLVGFLVSIDRSDDAVALGEYLLRRDPACVVCIFNLAKAYETLGKHAEAAQTLESTSVWHAPTRGLYWWLGRSWLLAGDPGKALQIFESELLDGSGEYGSILALHDLGRQEEFETRFSEYHETAPYAESVAIVYAWIGENDSAFEWLERAIAANEPNVMGSASEAYYSKIKTDPRWLSLRRENGMDPVVSNEVEFNYTLPAGASISD